MIRMKFPTLAMLNLVLILAILAMACNLGGTATPPLPTQGEAATVEVAPIETVPTEAVSTQAVPPTNIPTEEVPAIYVPDARLAFAGFNASPVQVQSYAVGMAL